MDIKIYARTMDHDKVLTDNVLVLPEFDRDSFYDFVSSVCQSMDLSTPVVLEKHYNQMQKFNHCVFLPNEFVESVDFMRFVIERMDADDKNSNVPSWAFDV